MLVFNSNQSYFHEQSLDPVVQHIRGKESFDFVEKAGIKGTFHTYKGLPHSANMEELTEVAKFIKTQLTDTKL